MGGWLAACALLATPPGAATFTLAGQSVTLPLGDGDKEQDALPDRFGVFNMQWANSKWCDVYLDDLTYTVSAP